MPFSLFFCELMEALPIVGLLPPFSCEPLPVKEVSQFRCMSTLCGTRKHEPVVSCLCFCGVLGTTAAPVWSDGRDLLPRVARYLTHNIAMRRVALGDLKSRTALQAKRHNSLDQNLAIRCSDLWKSCWRRPSSRFLYSQLREFGSCL